MSNEIDNKNIKDYLSIQLMSDLHVHPGEYEWQRYITKRKDVDILIILGDVMRLCDEQQYYEFMKDLCDNFPHVYLVPGNHEFYVDLEYGGGISNNSCFCNLYNIESRISNLTVLYNKFVDLPGNIRLYGTILWSHIPDEASFKYLPIRLPDRSLVNMDFFNKENAKAVSNIKSVIEQNKIDKKRLLIATHYPPSDTTLLDKHLTDPNHYWYSNKLDYMLSKDQVYLWMYGHTHNSKDFLTVGDTRVVSNQFRSKEYVRDKMLYIRSI